MPGDDPRNWSPWLAFDPAKGAVVREPPGEGPGYWVGAPGVTYCHSLRRFYMVYRLRRPRGVEPDRGAEIRIATSRDGITFDDVWTGTKDQLDSTSIERCALVHQPEGGWRLYVSFVNAADGRWQIGLAEAASPDALDLKATRPVLTASEVGAEGVKDPFVFRVAGLYHMVFSCAIVATAATPQELHRTHDAFNTGLILSASGLATSVDGLTWRPEGEILRPNPGTWDAYASRIGTLWHEPPAWLALYDGSADVSENYEERCGLAYSLDLRGFHRATRSGPLFPGFPPGKALRYFDVLSRDGVKYFYYEMARPDGSHDLRVYRTGPGEQ
jgi:hypothetical protein